MGMEGFMCRLSAIEFKIDILLGYPGLYDHLVAPEVCHSGISGERLAAECGATRTIQRYWRRRVSEKVAIRTKFAGSDSLVDDNGNLKRMNAGGDYVQNSVSTAKLYIFSRSSSNSEY